MMPVQAVRVYRCSGCITPLILNLALDEGNLSSSLSDRFTLLKEAGHPLSGRLGGP